MSTEHIPLADYQPGDKLNRVLLAVRAAKSCLDKNGKHYADLKVGDWSATKTAKVWKVGENEMTALCKAAFVEIVGDIDANEAYLGDIRVNQYVIADAPDDITDYIAQPGPSNREYKKRLTTLIQSVRDRELYNVLKLVFGPDEFRRKFSRAYAATSVHHGFAGGLLEHTVEVAEIASKTCEVLTGLDRHLLVTAALLHDIGKMDEMNQDLRVGEYTDDGVLIGHLVLGSTFVAQLIDRHNETASEIDKISIECKRALMHLILSHHGEPQYGAAKAPVFAEAAVLYYCDNMSAKTRQYHDVIDKNTAGETSVFNNMLGGRVYGKHPRPNAQPEIETDPTTFQDADNSNTRTGVVRLPVLGLVAAGSPDEKSTDTADDFRLVVPPSEGADYLVEATGDSMIDAGIKPGDLLFVRRQSTAREGDIVVAHIAGEGQTVKWFRLSNALSNGNGSSKPHLEAANIAKGYPNIEFNDGAQIQGRVTGLLRDY